MRLLVTGGLGYVGSFAARHLAGAGHEVTILDDLSTGHRRAAGKLPVVIADCRDVATVSGVLSHHRIEAVLHFAGLSLVGASVADPAAYYAANVGGSLGLLEAMRRAGVDRIVFSSSAAVYGNPSTQPIPESAPLAPMNPYGRSKAMVEGILRDAAAAGQVRAACLRYFNAAGASRSGDLGEDHHPETHLIPRLLAAAREGQEFTVHGKDYATPDGTAVRDYIHVEDLAEAHARALTLLEKTPFTALNLGTGRGYSVLEVLQTAETLLGKKIRSKFGARRSGDPDTLVASTNECKKTMNWSPINSNIEVILKSSILWHSNNVRS